MRARENPLRVERLHQLRHLPVGWTWEELDRRLVEFNYRGAIVGPHGSGKTTLLNDLERRWRARGMNVLRFMLNDEVREVAPDFIAQCQRDAPSVVLLDGAEQLHPRAWRGVVTHLQSCQGLIITSHYPGLLPTLVEPRTDPQLLHRLLIQLLTVRELKHLGDLPWTLCRMHDGNLREVLRGLYDHFANSTDFAPCTGGDDVHRLCDTLSKEN